MHRWKFPLLLGLLLAVAAFSGASPGGTAHAATSRAWTGAVDGVWSTPGNWSPAGAPVNGDSVQIGAAAFGKTLNNNRPAGLVLDTLAVSEGVTIVGNRIAISSAIQVTKVGVVVLDLPIVLAGDAQVSLPTDARLFMRARLSPIGTIALDMAGHTLTKYGGGEMEFDGDLIGTGTLAIQGGVVIFVYPITFAGTISLGGGTRVLLTVLGNGTGFCGSAPNATFVLSDAIFSAACVVSIRSISGSGEIEMFSADSRLFIAGAGSGAVFTGKITGAKPSQIMCCSSGGQTFRGASTFTGNIFVTSGALYLEGATFPATSGFTVQGGGGYRASLVGYGTFGETIITAGDLSLVDVNGKYGFARFPVLQFAPDALVNIEIAGPTPGVGFTQILMSGQIFLDSAFLRINFRGYTPAAGQSIALIYGATDLQDTFHDFADGKNLPEGGTFTVKGLLTDSGSDDLKFKITYKGGAGHDVVITRQAGAATPTPTATPTATPSPTPGQTKFKRFVPFVARDS